jgi:hypothetical protein
MNPCAYSEICRMNKEELDLTNSSLLHASLRIIDLEEALLKISKEGDLETIEDLCKEALSTGKPE